MVSANALNISAAGLVKFDGTNTFSGVTVTNHAVLVGATSNGITSLSVGATGTVLAGSTGADPSFTATPSVTSITLSSGTALSTYVEGTFTPGLSFGGGSTGITYNNQTGVYRQVGKCVFITLTVGITNKGSSTGTARITGLPVTSSATSGVNLTVRNGGGLTYPTNYTSATMFVDTAATTGIIYGEASASIGGLSAMTDANFAASTTIYVTGFYFT